MQNCHFYSAFGLKQSARAGVLAAVAARAAIVVKCKQQKQQKVCVGVKVCVSIRAEH